MYIGETRTFTFAGGVAPYKLHYTDNVWGEGVITSDEYGIALITAAVEDTFTYNFVSVEDATGCINYSGSAIDIWDVIVIKTPRVTAMLAEICEGEKLTLTFEGVPPFHIDYTSGDGNLPTDFGGTGYHLENLGDGVYQAEIQMNNAGTFSYTGTISDDVENENQASFSITVHPKATVKFPDTVDPCDGGDILVILSGTPPFVVEYEVKVAGGAFLAPYKLGLGNTFGGSGYLLTPTGNVNEYSVIIPTGSSKIMTFTVNSIVDSNGCVKIFEP
jgi:hypothetical protein